MRTFWATANKGGSLTFYWLVSAAVHAGLLAGLALLPSGSTLAPSSGYPVRLVRLSPPIETAATPSPAAGPAEKRETPPPASSPPLQEPARAARPLPRKEAPPPETTSLRPGPAPRTPDIPVLPRAVPMPPLAEEPAYAAPPAEKEMPPRPAPRESSILLPAGPRTASLPAPPAEGPPPSHVLRERLAQITARIEKAKRYPEGARLMGVEGTAVVAFRILPDGRVEDLLIRQTSGHSSLDAATLEAVRRAQPLPYVHHALVLPVRYTLRDAER